jgi:nucleoside-diphosphate-sugar epimerase
MPDHSTEPSAPRAAMLPSRAARPTGSTGNAVFMTGATGLIGAATLERLLARDASLRAHVLVRSRGGWRALAARLGAAADRVRPYYGNVTVRGLGLTSGERAAIRADTRAVLHLAADTVFSRPLGASRAVNREGTRHVLELAAECPRGERFAHVSTAYVAGGQVGRIPETAASGAAGWVNAYEQSKHEAELLVRGSGQNWTIFRPSTVVCESAGGVVLQVNAIHRALRLCHAGLAAMIPGDEDTPVDLVTTKYVAGAVAALALDPAADVQTFHLCAGTGALSLGELLDRSFARWSRDAGWRRRGVVRPALTDLATYRMFEASVRDTGDARLRRITRALSHFVPQLALPKHFDTAAADAALGRAAPPVGGYWDAVADRFTRQHRRAAVRSAA